jgi:hypothetical protein
MFASEGAELTFCTLDVQAIAQHSCKEALPDQPLRTRSLPVASLAINLRRWYGQYKKEK